MRGAYRRAEGRSIVGSREYDAGVNFESESGGGSLRVESATPAGNSADATRECRRDYRQAASRGSRLGLRVQSRRAGALVTSRLGKRFAQEQRVEFGSTNARASALRLDPRWTCEGRRPRARANRHPPGRLCREPGPGQARLRHRRQVRAWSPTSRATAGTPRWRSARRSCRCRQRRPYWAQSRWAPQISAWSHRTRSARRYAVLPAHAGPAERTRPCRLAAAVGARAGPARAGDRGRH